MAGSQRLSRRSYSPTFDDEESTSSSIQSTSISLGNADTVSKESGSNDTANGELVVTIISALLLFSHFGITLYKIDSKHPDSSIGKQQLKDRWALINICILVFALSSHLYRQALSNLKITFAPVVLVPDFCTALVILLILMKHIYFALYLLMAAVTFLSVMVTAFDMYAYVNPTKTVAGSKELKRTGEHKRDTEALLDSSDRSVVSQSSRRSRSGTNSVNLRDLRGMIIKSFSSPPPAIESSSSSVVSSGPGRKRATRSVIKQTPPKVAERKKLWG